MSKKAAVKKIEYMNELVGVRMLREQQEAALKKRKPTKIKEGITSKRTSTGINITISTNGRVLAVLRGYNNNQNVQKGLTALMRALEMGYNFMEGKFEITDLTPKPKKVAKKRP